MKLGYYISGIAHGVLILWLLFGGLFTPAREEPMVDVTEVSIVTAEEFAEMTEQAARPGVPDPVAPQTAPEATPIPPTRPTPPEVPADPTPPAPTPEPQLEPTPPAPEPAAPEPVTAPPEEVTPPEADRVAPEAAPAPDPQAETAPEVVEETAPADLPSEQPVEEVTPTAPEEATTEIVTEAETPAALAPESSPVPPARPARPTPPAPTPDTPTETATETPDRPETPTEDFSSAVDDALADVFGEQGTPGGTGTAPSGQPLTRGEKDALRIAVSSCWNLGSTSTDAMRTTVVVSVEMSQDGKPGAITLVSSDGPNQAAIDTAYGAARRAIIRCGASGYNLPSDKYEQWREIEMTFNPENMRIK